MTTPQCAPPGFDALLDERVRTDIVHYRSRRSVFAFLSLLLILAELFLGVSILVAHLNGDPYSTNILVLSSVSAFLITMDVSLGIRERAGAHHATLNQLLGIRNQLRFPSTSILWQEYSTVRAYTKINYIEATLDGCSWRLGGDLGSGLGSSLGSGLAAGTHSPPTLPHPADKN